MSALTVHPAAVIGAGENGDDEVMEDAGQGSGSTELELFRDNLLKRKKNSLKDINFDEYELPAGPIDVPEVSKASISKIKSKYELTETNKKVKLNMLVSADHEKWQGIWPGKQVLKDSSENYPFDTYSSSRTDELPYGDHMTLENRVLWLNSLIFNVVRIQVLDAMSKKNETLLRSEPVGEDEDELYAIHVPVGFVAFFEKHYNNGVSLGCKDYNEELLEIQSAIKNFIKNDLTPQEVSAGDVLPFNLKINSIYTEQFREEQVLFLSLMTYLLDSYEDTVKIPAYILTTLRKLLYETQEDRVIDIMARVEACESQPAIHNSAIETLRGKTSNPIEEKYRRDDVLTRAQQAAESEIKELAELSEKYKKNPKSAYFQINHMKRFQELKSKEKENLNTVQTINLDARSENAAIMLNSLKLVEKDQITYLNKRREEQTNPKLSVGAIEFDEKRKKFKPVPPEKNASGQPRSKTKPYHPNCWEAEVDGLHVFFEFMDETPMRDKEDDDEKDDVILKAVKHFLEFVYKKQLQAYENSNNPVQFKNIYVPFSTICKKITNAGYGQVEALKTIDALNGDGTLKNEWRETLRTLLRKAALRTEYEIVQKEDDHLTQDNEDRYAYTYNPGKIPQPAVVVAIRRAGAPQMKEGIPPPYPWQSKNLAAYKSQQGRKQGLLIGDPMGMGKTRSAIMCMIDTLASTDDAVALILAPGSLLKQWEDHIIALTTITIDQIANSFHRASEKKIEFENFHKHGKKVVITTYEMFSSRLKVKLDGKQPIGTDVIDFANGKDGKHFKMMILDEVHKWRNSTKSSGIIYDVIQRTVRMLNNSKDSGLVCLTGTPLVQTWGDFATYAKIMNVKPETVTLPDRILRFDFDDPQWWVIQSQTSMELNEQLLNSIKRWVVATPMKELPVKYEYPNKDTPMPKLVFNDAETAAYKKILQDLEDSKEKRKTEVPKLIDVNQKTFIAGTLKAGSLPFSAITGYMKNLFLLKTFKAETISAGNVAVLFNILKANRLFDFKITEKEQKGLYAEAELDKYREVVKEIYDQYNFFEKNNDEQNREIQVVNKLMQGATDMGFLPTGKMAVEEVNPNDDDGDDDGQEEGGLIKNDRAMTVAAKKPLSTTIQNMCEVAKQLHVNQSFNGKDESLFYSVDAGMEITKINADAWKATHKATDLKRKVIIFSQYTMHLMACAEILHEQLKTEFPNMVMPKVFHGGTAPQVQQDILKEFREDPNCPFIFINLKAGGVGIDITAASAVIFMDCWWTKSMHDQAVARALRPGQTRDVRVVYIMPRQSIGALIREDLHATQAVLEKATIGTVADNCRLLHVPVPAAVDGEKISTKQTKILDKLRGLFGIVLKNSRPARATGGEAGGSGGAPAARPPPLLNKRKPQVGALAAILEKLRL